MAITPNTRQSLLSSQARIQVPWIKVTIGNYTFGAFDKVTRRAANATNYGIQYPNYIQSLNIAKINGQVNTYTLNLSYPVRSTDDPNFFEKVFSSVSSTRKIVFSYGDTAYPTYIYKDEEAIITKVTNNFNLEGSVINYTVTAVSAAALSNSGNFTFVSTGVKQKPSTIIKKLFWNSTYGLQNIFTGMNAKNVDTLIRGDDAAVEIPTKTNITVLDYITYLVSCMVPSGKTSKENRTNDIYVLVIHDDTSYDKFYYDSTISGPYFEIKRVSHTMEHTDAYTIDVGYNTSTIVTNFSIENSENYSILYDYQQNLNPQQYIRRINADGKWEDIYAPTSTSSTNYLTETEDITWWTKITKYPIKASITIQGLLRPATLMTYVRLNVIFPGGHKHISSGLYIVTKQEDQLSGSGFKTVLSLVKISGDTNDQ